jgi:hypothetical protein
MKPSHYFSLLGLAPYDRGSYNRNKARFTSFLERPGRLQGQLVYFEETSLHRQ